MATRNLTSRFENLRAQRQQRSFSPYDRSTARDDGFPLLSEQGPSLPPSLPPRWVDEVDRFQETVSKIKANMKELSKLHAQRLNEKFSEDKAAHLDNQIGVYTTETSSMFSEAQNRIKCIALVGNDSHLSFQERTVRLNVMRHLGGDIQAMSKEFRKMQKDFMYRMKGLDELGDYLGDSEEKTEGSIRAMLDEDQMSAKAKGQLSLLLKEGTEREKQIAALLVSINELNTIFRDLNTLVIEQGSILDRIDYNVEQALTKTKEGTKQLVKAEKRSRHARSLICIGLLIVIIAILSGILYYKKH